MIRKTVVFACLAMALGWCAAAAAALCPKCQDLMFAGEAGKCVVCGAATDSAALKLCPRCSAALHRCEHCLAALDADAKPLPPGVTEKAPGAGNAPEGAPPAVPPSSGTAPSATPPATPPAGPPAGPPAAAAPAGPATPAAAPPATPKPIDPNRAGTYVSGRWQYTLEITDPGTRIEGRSGWLFYDGRKLPRGQVNDFYRTPWGPVYWVDAPPTKWGLHGWMPFPSRQANRTGRALALPAPPPQWFEIGKAQNGKRVQVPVGQWVLVRLQGNPTTGYQWQTAAVKGQSVRMMAEPQYVATPVKPGVVGGGGTFYFKFRALQPGLTTIKLIYLRPWLKDQPPLESFQCTVEVLTPRPAPPPHACRPQGDSPIFAGFAAKIGTVPVSGYPRPAPPPHA
jgi:inhibitor of cysteine peptidase